MVQNITTKNIVELNGVEIHLFDPIDDEQCWIGQGEIYTLLVASWLKLHKNDRIMTPVLIGPPGSGKTTLARVAAREFNRPLYMMNCTSDIRPEDLLIMLVLSAKQEIRYQASSLVSAMITGGTCILDEANRMTEKAWASLASLLDDRRYIESITAGIRIMAHPEFRMVATMNEDYSTFAIPEFIESRLKPVLAVDYPSQNELKEILVYNVPHADKELTEAIISYLTDKQNEGSIEEYSIRDAIHIAELSMKFPKEKRTKKSGTSHLDSIARYVVKVNE